MGSRRSYRGMNTSHNNWSSLSASCAFHLSLCHVCIFAKAIWWRGRRRGHQDGQSWILTSTHLLHLRPRGWLKECCMKWECLLSMRSACLHRVWTPSPSCPSVRGSFCHSSIFIYASYEETHVIIGFQFHMRCQLLFPYLSSHQWAHSPFSGRCCRQYLHFEVASSRENWSRWSWWIHHRVLQGRR